MNGYRHLVMAHRVDDAIRVESNLAGLAHDELEAVFSALAQHHGLDAMELAKKKTPALISHEPPDPRFPELTALIRAARRDWQRWGDKLVKRISTLLERGQLLPLNAKNEAALRELLEDHRTQIVIQMTGHAPDKSEFRRLVKKGLISKDIAEKSYLETAWKLGRGLEMLEGHKYRPRKDVELATAVKKSLQPKLTRHDQEALDYTKRRGAIYMRKPADLFTGEAERLLNDEEYRVIRRSVAEGVERKWDRKRVARQLHEAVQGITTIDPTTGEEIGVYQNNMNRVARTELANAYNHGAYTGLKEDAAKAGEHDPLVYKFASPQACDKCREIWGPPGDPKHYRLSEIEAREDAGANFQKKRRNWGPTIGPIHPHCFPAGVRVVTARGEQPIEKVMVGDQVWTHRGRWRRVTTTMSRAADLIRLDGIPVTRRHPFLTGRGWVEAGKVKPGDHLFEPLEIRFPHPNNIPSKGTKASLFSVILVLLLESGVPVSAIDFDREFSFRHREVYQEALDLISRLEKQALSGKGHKELSLESRFDLASLGRNRTPNHFLGLFGPPDSGIGGLRISLPLLFRHIDISESNGVASVSMEPHGGEMFAHGASMDANGFGDRADRVSSVEPLSSPSHIDSGLSSVIRLPAVGVSLSESLVDKPDAALEPGSDLRRAESLVDIESHNIIDGNGRVSPGHIGPHRIVEVKHYPIPAGRARVYNLSVAGDESYIAEGRMVHNCLCGPLMYYHPKLMDLIQEAAADFTESMET